MTGHTKIILLLLFVAFLVPLNAITIRLLAQDLGPFFGNSLRVILAAALSFIFLRRYINLKKFGQISKRDKIILLVSGLVGWAIGVWLFTKGIIQTSLVNAFFIDALSPLAVYVYSLILLKQSADRRVLLLTLVSIYGVLVIGTRNLVPTIDKFGLGELFLIGNVIFWAVGFVGRKMLSDHLNSVEISFLLMIISSLGLFILGIASGFDSQKIVFSTNTGVLLVIGAVITLLTFNLMTYCLRRIDATVASQITLTKVLFSFLLGFLFFGETLPPIVLLGGLIVVVSVFLSSRLRHLPKVGSSISE